MFDCLFEQLSELLIDWFIKSNQIKYVWQTDWLTETQSNIH